MKENLEQFFLKKNQILLVAALIISAIEYIFTRKLLNPYRLEGAQETLLATSDCEGENISNVYVCIFPL